MTTIPDNGSPQWVGAVQANIGTLTTEVGKMRDWMVEHDRMEARWHGRIEAHLARSSENREAMTRTLDLLQKRITSLEADLDALRTKLFYMVGAGTVTGAIVATIATVIVDHLMSIGG